MRDVSIADRTKTGQVGEVDAGNDIIPTSQVGVHSTGINGPRMFNVVHGVDKLAVDNLHFVSIKYTGNRLCLKYTQRNEI